MNLFEELAARANCMISDLRDDAHVRWTREMLEELARGPYGMREWTELAAYLVGETPNAANPEEVVRFIMSRT